MSGMRALLVALLIMPTHCMRLKSKPVQGIDARLRCKDIDSHPQSLQTMWGSEQDDKLWRKCLSCGNSDNDPEDLAKQFARKVSKGSPCAGFSKSYNGSRSCAEIKGTDGQQLCHVAKKFLFDTSNWQENRLPHWLRQEFCVPCVLEPIEDEVESVSFPGTYAAQLGGVNWSPVENISMAGSLDDGATFNLKLNGLLPGDYFFKAVVNPRRNGWAGVVGDPAAENIRFHVAPGVVATMLNFITATKKIIVGFEEGPIENDVTVSFPGDYCTQLGGENWVPTDPKVQGNLWKDRNIFVKTIIGLIPGKYTFKAVIDAEKNRAHNGGWRLNYGEGGELDGKDITFVVGPDVRKTTLTFNVETRVSQVHFDLPCSDPLE